MTVSMVLPEFVMVWAIKVPLPPANPDKLIELGVAVQVKVDPITWDWTVIFVVCCEQIVWAAGVKKTSAVGNTVTTYG